MSKRSQGHTDLGLIFCSVERNKKFRLAPNFGERIMLFKPVKWLSCVWLFAILWTVAHQASPSMEFSRQEYWGGLPFPSPGDLDPGIEPRSPSLQADTLPSAATAKSLQSCPTLFGLLLLSEPPTKMSIQRKTTKAKHVLHKAIEDIFPKSFPFLRPIFYCSIGNEASSFPSFLMGHHFLSTIIFLLSTIIFLK